MSHSKFKKPKPDTNTNQIKTRSLDFPSKPTTLTTKPLIPWSFQTNGGTTVPHLKRKKTSQARHGPSRTQKAMARHNHKNETQNHDHDPTLRAPITTRLTCRWHQKSRKGRNRSPGTEGGANPTGTQTLGCRQAPAMAARITSGNGSGMGDGREWNRT